MKRCHKCGEEWTRREQPGFKETCPKCTSYLHVCVNCKLYNPTAEQCSSVTAECTGDRKGLSYCEEFQFRDVPNNASHRAAGGTALNGRASGDGAGKTLGPGGPESGSGPSDKPSKAARKKFDKLFNE